MHILCRACHNIDELEGLSSAIIMLNYSTPRQRKRYASYSMYNIRVVLANAEICALHANVLTARNYLLVPNTLVPVVL